MTPAQGREMLTAMVAVQLNLITHGQFVDALSEWVTDKDVAFAEILRRRGDAAEDSLALIDSVVDKHIQMHGGDVEASLAALHLSSLTAGQLEVVDDPVVQQTRSMIGETPAGSVGDASQISGREAEPAGRGRRGEARRGRFTILKRLDSGGLGDVFIAEDAELNRLVALKEIQSRYADRRDSRARFVQEGEVTGQLEHPGIVPIYGLGTDSDGNPFYAMRLVRGDNMAQAIARFFEARPRPRTADFHGTDFRRLLGRFVDVCEAVQFAHDRGVLHRDLKPGNVMLGRHGETLVVDWGLAKATGLSGDPEMEAVRTQSGGETADPPDGNAVGTPHYMSPEAARGEVSGLTAATDVYSLGATLYQMLTGQTAFEAGPGLLERVADGRFPPPRDRQPAVPKALQAVCLKAMSALPADRYASCRALAEDVERFLADEAVRAMPDPLPTRVARTVRRHQGAFATAAVLGTVSLIAVSALALRLADRNRQLVAANAEATRQRDIAAKSAEISQGVAEELAGVIEDNLGENPGDQEKRNTLIRTLSDYVESLASIANEPDDLLLTRAHARRIAAALKRTDRRYAEAAEDLDAGVGLARRAAEVGLSDGSDLVRLLTQRAIARRYTERNAEATEDLKEAGELLASLVAERPDDAGVRRLAGRWWVERFGEAEVLMDAASMLAAARRADEYNRPLGDAEGADDKDRAFALLAGGELQRAYWGLGRREEAAAAFEDVIARGRRWADGPRGRNCRHLAARLLCERCECLLEEPSRPAEFAALAAEAADRYRALVEDLGDDYPLYRHWLRRADLLVAIAEADAGDLEGADDAAAAVGDYFTALLDGDEHTSEFLTDAASVAGWRATFAEMNADTAAEQAFLMEAVRRQTRAVELSPEVVHYQRLLEGYRRRLAAVASR